MLTLCNINACKMIQTEISIYKARLKAKGSVELRLKGSCMNPLLQDGEIAIIVPTDKYKVGDMCLAEFPDGCLILHRIVDIRNEKYILKGDRARRAECLPERSLIGVASAVHNDKKTYYLAKSRHIAKIQAFVSRQSILYEYDSETGNSIERGRAIHSRLCERLLIIVNALLRKVWIKSYRSVNENINVRSDNEISI